MKNRVLSLLIALFLVVGLIPAADALETSTWGLVTVDGIIYFLKDTYAEVYGYEGEPVDVVLASEVEGLPVTVIGGNAFENCASLRTVQIPNSVTTIGYSSFRWSGLTEVFIPASVTELGSSAFVECLNLTSIEVDEENPTYWSMAGILYGHIQYFGSYHDILMQVPAKFTGTLTVPEGTYAMDEDAVSGCTGITMVNLPASWGHFSTNDFNSCTNLTAIHVDDANEKFYDIDGVLYGPVTSYDENDNQIERLALLACPAAYSASKFTIPNGVVLIGSHAFNNCANIANLYIPASTTSIYTQNFIGCDSLIGIWVDEANPTFMSDDCGVVYNRECVEEEYRYDEATDELVWYDVVYPDMSILHFFPTGLTGCYEIPEGVVQLAYDSLYCANINALIFPTTLNKIIDYALGNCENLEWMLFRGDLPESGYSILNKVVATIYYPAGNRTWSNVTSGDPFYSYLSELTYVSYAAGEEPVPPFEMVEPTPVNPFTDVPEGSFYYDPVMWAISNNITNGLTADTFGPTATCNRAQVVTFLWRAAGEPEPTSTENPFADVAAGSFYEKPVLWAVEKGITNGSDATHFNPGGDCNRAQVVTFLYRAFESPAVNVEGLPFADVPAGSWYEAPIAWAVENGITNGLSATEFGPNASCNRAQVVTFLYRAYN